MFITSESGRIRNRSSHARKHTRFRPQVEFLEDRTLLDVAPGLFSNEPDVEVNPFNANNVIIGAGTQLRISTDGGATFPTLVNPRLPAGQTGFGGDDSLAFDANGRLFWTYLTSPGFNVVVEQVDPLTGALIFGAPVTIAAATGANGLDKEWIAADSNPVSPFANNLYVVWHDFDLLNAPIRFARSIDQGVNWTIMPGNISGAGQGFTWPSEVAVGRNGDVWVAWSTNTGATTGEVRMRRSTDGGMSFGPELIPFPAGTAAATTNVGTGVANKIAGIHVWMQGARQPRILVDPIRPNTLYVVTIDDPDAFNVANDPADVVFARSTDNGANWTRITISQGAYGNTEIMPSAAIDASGNIIVTWYDNRRGLTNPDATFVGTTYFLLDLFSTTSTDGGLTFSAPVRINDVAFDPELGAPDRVDIPNGIGPHTLRPG